MPVKTTVVAVEMGKFNWQPVGEPAFLNPGRTTRTDLLSKFPQLTGHIPERLSSIFPSKSVTVVEQPDNAGVIHVITPVMESCVCGDIEIRGSAVLVGSSNSAVGSKGLQIFVGR